MLPRRPLTKARSRSRNRLSGRPTPKRSPGQRYVGYGDRLFVQEKYADANDRYRKAIQSAARTCRSPFPPGIRAGRARPVRSGRDRHQARHGHDPKWPNSGFDLDKLYGNNTALKRADLDSLPRRARRADNADLAFLVGVYLHFDGQTERARGSPHPGAELSGNNADIFGRSSESRTPSTPRRRQVLGLGP